MNYILKKQSLKKSRIQTFTFFLRVEFNLYLPDATRYEIPHRHKKTTERRMYILCVQFGTNQVQFQVVKGTTVTNHI